MKSDISIKVDVPQPWRFIGRIFIAVGLLGTCLFVWKTFFNSEAPEEIILINTMATLILYPVVVVFFIPVFIGRYPSWIVRLIGSKFLLKFISDCETLVSARRVNKATLTNPYSWLADQRLVWLLIIGALMLLGIYYGNIYGQ